MATHTASSSTGIQTRGVRNLDLTPLASQILDSVVLAFQAELFGIGLGDSQLALVELGFEFPDIVGQSLLLASQLCCVLCSGRFGSL